MLDTYWGYTERGKETPLGPHGSGVESRYPLPGSMTLGFTSLSLNFSIYKVGRMFHHDL